MGYTLFGEIKKEVLTIQRSIFRDENNHADDEWQRIKRQIVALAAETILWKKEMAKERREEARAERAARKKLSTPAVLEGESDHG